uniref:Uncharacterized protein n=1 Tax=Nomascus leucogenys TaxID=61853 RepID=A0A2I3GZ71_NOMLE
MVSHSSWEAGSWAPWQPGSALRSQLRCQCLGLPRRLCGGVGWASPFIHLRERGGGSEMHRWGTSHEDRAETGVCGHAPEEPEPPGAGGGCAGSSPELLEGACPGRLNVGLLAAELRINNSLSIVNHPGCGNLLWPPCDASTPPSLMSGAKAGRVKYLGLKALGFLR